MSLEDETGDVQVTVGHNLSTRHRGELGSQVWLRASKGDQRRVRLDSESHSYYR